MAISSKEMKDIAIAVSLGLSKSDCGSPVNTDELEDFWLELELELREIRAKGWIIDIPWDPFE